MADQVGTSDLIELLSSIQWNRGWMALAILLAGILGSIVLNRMCEHRLAKLLPAVSPAARALMGRLVRFGVLALASVLALEALGVSVTSLLAAGTVLFVGLGLAMQKILQSLVAGTLLLLEREIEPGDIVRFEGREHRVQKIGIRTTQFEDRNRETLILPNYIVATSPLVNLTHRTPSVRLSMDVEVAYGSDSAVVEEALRQAALSIDGRTAELPQVLLTHLGNHGVTWKIRVEIQDPWELTRSRSALGRRVLEELAKVGVTIPFPQLDVHLPPTGESA